MDCKLELPSMVTASAVRVSSLFSSSGVSSFHPLHQPEVSTGVISLSIPNISYRGLLSSPAAGRRDFLRGIALASVLLIKSSDSKAREVEVGSYLPLFSSDPSFVLFRASPSDTPALRAGIIFRRSTTSVGIRAWSLRRSMYCRRSAVDDVRSRRTRAVDEDRRRIRWAVDEDRHRRRWAIDDDRRRRRREIDDYPPLELPLQWRDPPLEYPSLFHFASRKGIRKQPVVVDDYPPLELPLRWRDPPPEYPPLELPLRWRDPPLPITSVSDSVHLQRKPTRARPDASAQLTGPIPAPSPPAAADQTPAHPTSDSPTRHVHELDLSRPYPSLVACFDSVEMELQLEICRLPALPADDSKAVRVPDSAMEGNHSNSVVYPAPPPARARSVPCCSRETDDEREPTPCDERDSTPGYERISAPGDERIFAPKTVTPGAIAMLLSIGDRQLDLDKQQSIAAKAEPKTEKDAESLSLTKQIPGWSDGIPPFGFMAHVPPPPFGLDDASTSSSKAVQRLFSSQLRPKALCNSLLYCTDRESPSADDKISSILVCSSCHPMQKGNLPANPSTDSSQKKTTSGRNKFVKLVEWTEPYLSNSQKLHCIMNPDANHGDGETKLNDNYNVGDVNDFTAGVEMPGLNSTENIDPTRCSQVARRNVADDYGYLFLGSSSGVGERMLLRIQQQGLYITPRILIVTRLLPDAVGTTCGQHLEKVIGTEHTDYCQIFRVPFRTENRIIRQWISCFEVWPYLETYADDVADKLVGELLATPDLIIGNYSNGNLVAFLLAHKLGVTQYTKAHALKKTKYPNSDIYWKNFEEQFTADLITMNHADFIIKSTFQEFAGRQGLSRLYGHDSNPQTTHVVWTLGYVISEVTRIRTAITSTDVFSLRRFLREDMYKRIKIFDPGGLLMISTPISLPLITSTESSFLNARGE